MRNSHSVPKKILAVLLSALMVLSAFGMGIVVPSLVARAADTRSASLPVGDLKFIVPEAIYLYPNGSSAKSATASPFQYYVNNDANNAPVQAAATTGKIYYEYAYEYDSQYYGAATASIGYQFVDASFRSLSGGSVTLSSSTIASGDSVDITGGKSPSLGSAVNGCYILWDLKFTDTADGLEKHVYALTYVYKPYVVPVGVMVETFNKYANDSHANTITWISGMHSITQQTSATHDGNYYPNYSGDHGMAGFITAGDTAYVDNTQYTAANTSEQNKAWTDSYAGATRYKLAFIGTATSGAHFNDTSGHDNEAATNWGAGASSGSTFNVSSFDYWYKTIDPWLWGRQALAAVYATPYGNITIDTSRYSDLAQIPNLGVGLMVTNNEEATRANWYVADYSGNGRVLSYNATHTDDSNSDDEKDTYFRDRTYVIAGQGTDAWGSLGDDYKGEGVKYAGAWPRSLVNVPAANDTENSLLYVSSYDYAVKGMFGTADKGSIDNPDNMDYCFAHGTVRLTAKQYNKSTLRAAVQKAISVMATLGVKGIANGNIESYYFDANDNYGWPALQIAFKNALLGLTTLGSTANPNDLANDLLTALRGLKTKVSIDDNHGTFSPALKTEMWVSVGEYVLNHDNAVVTPQLADGSPVLQNSGSRFGYTFEGWSADPDQKTPGLFASAIVGFNDTLYAVWKPVEYSITLSTGYGTEQEQVIKYTIENTKTITELLSELPEEDRNPDFSLEREGHYLQYWLLTYKGATCNWGEVDVDQITSSTPVEDRYGNVHLKAVWGAGEVNVNVYYYDMNKNGSYLNAVNRLVPTRIENPVPKGTAGEIFSFTPRDDREGFSVDAEKSRLNSVVASNGSTVIKVFYARKPYDVVFKNYDGTELQTTTCLFEAAPLYTGATPRRAAADGVSYTFYGWSDGERTYTPEQLKSYETTGATEFTAVFTQTLQLFSVTAVPGTGAVIDCAEGTYRYGDTLTVSAAAQDGYIADGLTLYANGTEVANPYAFTVTENVEFTTNDLENKPSYLVKFYAWDGELINSISVTEGADASGMVTPPDREGYTFTKWSLPVNNVTENLTVIAQYTKDGAENYVFDFYQDAKLLASLVREEGEVFEYPETILGQPAKTGFDFMGWDKTFSPAAEDLEVFAVFQPNGYVESYTLTVKFGYDKPDETYTQQSGSTVTVEYPERAGYAFTGWTGDTSNLHGKLYSFGEADETITAAWYDLTELNAAAAAVEGVLAERSLYRSDYGERLDALLAEKGTLLAVVPASADDLDDLTARMNAAVADAPNYLLYTLHVLSDGVEIQTLQNISGATVNITAAPEKTGYSLKEWVKTEGGGILLGTTYQFAAGNATVEARWVIDNAAVASLRAQIEALSDEIYCEGYLAELMDDLIAIEAMDLNDPANNDAVAEAIGDLSTKLSQKDQHKHKYTVFSDHDATEPPTCTAAGYDIYVCENCSSRTKRVAAEPLGHSWGEWTVVKEATYGVDGLSKRTCERCGKEESVVTSLNDQSDKAVRFVTIENMRYELQLGNGGDDNVSIRSITTFRWFSTQELRFKVVIGSDFVFQSYVVYLNGEPIQPDGEGFYTVPASPELATVGISGVVPENPLDPGSGSSSGGVSFWQWIVNLFRSIADFFRNLFK